MKLDISGFFADVTNFVRGGRVLGIDIGTSSVKVAELTRARGVFSLANYGILETSDYLRNPNQAIQSSGLAIDPAYATRLLETLLREVQPKAKKALVTIPSFLSFVTTFDMPVLPASEMERGVQFQARQFIPLPIEQVSVDWAVVSQYEGERGQSYQRILLIGIPNDVIEAYTNICTAAHLSVVAFELESLSLLRSVPQVGEGPLLILDIGALVTNMIVVYGGRVQYSSQVDYGGAYLTHGLSQSLGLGMLRAEDLKRHSGLTGTGNEAQLSTLLPSYLDVIIEEVNNVRGVYGQRYSQKIETLALVGGGANLLGVAAYAGEQLGLHVHAPSVFFDVMYDPRLEPAVSLVGHELAAALGAAKGYFS